MAKNHYVIPHSDRPWFPSSLKKKCHSDSEQYPKIDQNSSRLFVIVIKKSNLAFLLIYMNLYRLRCKYASPYTMYVSVNKGRCTQWQRKRHAASLQPWPTIFHITHLFVDGIITMLNAHNHQHFHHSHHSHQINQKSKVVLLFVLCSTPPPPSPILSLIWTNHPF